MDQYYEVILCPCGNPEHTCPKAVVPSLDIGEFEEALKTGKLKPADGRAFNRKRLIKVFKAAVLLGRFKLIGSGAHTARGTEV
jgi:hypothetical protein